MTDIAHLGFDVDSSTAVKATTDLDRLGDQAAITERQVTGAAGKSSKAFSTMAASARSAGTGFRSIDTRMISMQLSQVAQQAAAGGGVLRALAIQLPDIGLAFGTVGIAAGVVAGALLPVIGNMLQTEGGAKALKDALEDLEEISDRLQDSLDILGMTARELSDEFDGASGRTRELALAQAELRVAEANQALREQIRLLDDVANAYTTTAGGGRDFKNTIDRVSDAFGVSADQARLLENSIQDYVNAADYDSQVQALQNMVDLMRAFGTDLTKIPPEFASALDETISLTREMDAARALANSVAEAAGLIADATGGAADQAARLAGSFAAAINLQSQLNTQSSLTYSGRGGDPRQFMEGGSQADYSSAVGYTSVDDLIARYTPKVAGGRRGGGGGGGVDPMLAEAERIFDDTRTAAEEYAAELEHLNELHEKGYIDAETYVRAIDQADEKFREASEAGEEFSAVTDLLKDAILDFAMDGEVAMDRLAESIKRAALEALLFGEGPLGKLFGGVGGGGILGMIFGGIPSRAGGGFTWTGPRSGGLDGQGGQLALLHPNETVVDHAQGQSFGPSITYAPVIDARGADQAAVARLASVVAEDRKMFAENVQRVMRNTGMRGR